MKKMLVVLMVLVTVLCAFAVVSADQNGTKCWCNVDEYGCWVTEEDEFGNTYQSYIKFWSEDARNYIMGSLSDPYTLVMPRAK